MKNADGTVEAYGRLFGLVRELREKCPWDREQKLGDAAKYLIEEAYEAADAIARNNNAETADELGDLLAAMIMAIVIAEDEGRFAADTLIDGATAKLIRRHPHVYGDAKADTAAEVLANWDRIKREENHSREPTSGLEKIGRALPALMRAEKLGEHARRAGMDWADARGVLAKVREELGEAERALERGETDAAAEEIGDMLLALANAPRFLGHSAEQTLRRACVKFAGRFDQVAKLAASRGIDLKKLAPEEVEALWQAAKQRRVE
jgi:MazG family protein